MSDRMSSSPEYRSGLLRTSLGIRQRKEDSNLPVSEIFSRSPLRPDEEGVKDDASLSPDEVKEERARKSFDCIQQMLEEIVSLPPPPLDLPPLCPASDSEDDEEVQERVEDDDSLIELDDTKVTNEKISSVDETPSHRPVDASPHTQMPHIVVDGMPEETSSSGQLLTQIPAAQHPTVASMDVATRAVSLEHLQHLPLTRQFYDLPMAIVDHDDGGSDELPSALDPTFEEEEEEERNRSTFAADEEEQATTKEDMYHGDSTIEADTEEGAPKKVPPRPPRRRVNAGGGEIASCGDVRTGPFEAEAQQSPLLSNAAAESESENEGESEKQRVLREIVSSEYEYLRRLQALNHGYFQASILQREKFGIEPNELEEIFSNIDMIYRFHLEFYHELYDRQSEWVESTPIGDLFLRFTPFMKVYLEYVKDYDSRLTKLDNLVANNDKFSKWIEGIQIHESQNGFSLLHSLLIAPVQRIPRYVLLIQRLLDITPAEDPDHKILERAICCLREVASKCNEKKKETEASERLLKLQELSVMGTELQLMVHLKTMVDPSCTVSKSFLQLPSNEETNCNRSPSPKRGKSPLRAYPPMKLLDFNGHRDILFEARTKYSEMREGKVLMIQSARMFVFTDCFGIALLTGDSQVPYKFIHMLPYLSEDSVLSTCQYVASGRHDARRHRRSIMGKTKSRVSMLMKRSHSSEETLSNVNPASEVPGEDRAPGTPFFSINQASKYHVLIVSDGPREYAIISERRKDMEQWELQIEQAKIAYMKTVLH